MATAFATAIAAWDKTWSTAEGRADWLDPDPDVMALLPELKARGARTALDLGCGVGRRSLFLFAGFELLCLKQRQHRKPGSWHWHIIAERRPQETIS